MLKLAAELLGGSGLGGMFAVLGGLMEVAWAACLVLLLHEQASMVAVVLS